LTIYVYAALLCQNFEQQPEAFLKNSIAVIAAPSMYEVKHLDFFGNSSINNARIALLS